MYFGAKYFCCWPFLVASFNQTFIPAFIVRKQKKIIILLVFLVFLVLLVLNV
jgi:hypothetical protein